MERTNRIIVHIALAVVVATTIFAVLAVPLTLHTLVVAKYRAADGYGYGMMDRFDRYDGGMMGRGWSQDGGRDAQEYEPRYEGCPGYDDAEYGY